MVKKAKKKEEKPEEQAEEVFFLKDVKKRHKEGKKGSCC